MTVLRLLALMLVLLSLNFSPRSDRSEPGPLPQSSTAQAASPPRAARIWAQITELETLLPSLVDKGAGLYLLAVNYAQLGQEQKALALLKQCASLNEGYDPDGDAAFKRLRSDPGFRQLVREIRRSYPPVHQARVAFTVPQNDLFPEGLAVDSEWNVFYMGSMHLRKIVRITPTGKVSDFVKPGLYDLMPVGGIHVDPQDHSIWAATDPGEKNRSELVHFDVRGKLLERYPITGTGAHDLNDLVIRNAREIYASDTFANQVYRFDRQAHIFIPLHFPRPLIEPNGITVSGDKNLLYAADSLGVIAMDLRSGKAREVQPGTGNTLAGIDGLYWYEQSLVGVQYGTGAYRVGRWRLSEDGLRVTSTRIFERGTRFLSDPTTGAILTGRFYFMANTGIYNLNDDKIVDPGKLQPIHIAVVSLD